MNQPNNARPDVPLIAVNREEEELPRERMARPRSHSTGAGGVLAKLYGALTKDITGVDVPGPVIMSKLMSKYLANCANGDPSFNKTNTRGNMNKELSASTMTFRTFCRALIFWEFTKVRITIEGVREGGAKHSASVEVNFSLPEQGEDNSGQQG